ncbi:MAG TPA: hypothetical protein VHE34_13970 [Puia sp.]|uniref:hypothetical protein n=1 Tax=Puia sp. TaxID=2045100 RepID=UPI002C4838D4|nr:hypothetical protein [Puia sp.]HVU96331.1 hypothetical protein [Puia sp.]
MKHFYPLIFGLLAALCVHGQDRLPEGISHDSSIHEMRVRYTHFVYSANDSIIHRREIMSRLRLYSETAGELRRYRNARAGVFLWTGAAIGSLTTAIVEGNHGNRAAAWSFGGAAFIALLGRFSAQVSAAFHFRQAIHVYNKRFIP